ncbi:MAG: hypothetical protein K2O88_00950 [Paramuribaculum sp.]|nr:hypothetical protein [Paramuribaculum sp.]
MKFNKIIAITVALLAFTSCSDDDVDYNSNGGVTVEMADATLSVEENVKDGLLNVPIVVKGNANGMVKVDIAISSPANEGAIEDKHFLVTGKTINIPADKKEGYVEIFIKDDRFKNPNHSFNVTITSAEGATIGAIKSTTVTIVDNDQTLYGRIQGTWRMNGFDGFSDNALKQRYCTISGVPEDMDGFGTTLFLDFTDDDAIALHVEAKLVKATDNSGQEFDAIAISCPQKVGTYSSYDLQLFGSDGNQIYGGNLLAVINGDESEIIWASQMDFAVVATAGSQVAGFWDYYYDLSWDRD